jgi:hypothetical protein
LSKPVFRIAHKRTAAANRMPGSTKPALGEAEAILTSEADSILNVSGDQTRSAHRAKTHRAANPARG